MRSSRLFAFDSHEVTWTVPYEYTHASEAEPGEKRSWVVCALFLFPCVLHCATEQSPEPFSLS